MDGWMDGCAVGCGCDGWDGDGGRKRQLPSSRQVGRPDGRSLLSSLVAAGNPPHQPASPLRGSSSSSSSSSRLKVCPGVSSHVLACDGVRRNSTVTSRPSASRLAFLHLLFLKFSLACLSPCLYCLSSIASPSFAVHSLPRLVLTIHLPQSRRHDEAFQVVHCRH